MSRKEKMYEMKGISKQIWDMKYRFKKADGTILDETIEDTWRRVARALAAPESDSGKWEPIFYEALEDFKFIPAGRIIAGAGTRRNVTLSNCFTMGTIPDSMEGIFTHLKEAALTMQAGGGIGYDFSTIRPRGAHVRGVDADASGPLTFMDVWDAMCRTVMSAGSRRGAMMATMRCDHPDILSFIEAKSDPQRLRMFNVSVLITDSFMEAAKREEEWDLHFEGKLYDRIPARTLWNKIMESTYAYAEPGVIFIDRVNEMHNIRYLETISTTNPCGEKPMGPYASCLLGSINLTKFVRDPFASSSIDYGALFDTVQTAIRMMDNVIEAGKFPLSQQEQKAKEDRQLGLGMTGLADALTMLGLRYGSNEAIQTTEYISRYITESAYVASVELAEEKGVFPTYDRDKFVNSKFVLQLSQHIQEKIRKHGIRNSLLTSIAPTGTISLLAENISSGIEPIFANDFTRKVLQPDGTRTNEVVRDYAVAEFQRRNPDLDLPDQFVTMSDLTPSDHVQMQAAAQRWMDSSISKTVNVPENISFEDFKQVYLEAYESGCKGCTTYRPNEVTGSVLSVEGGKKSEPLSELAPRPENLQGTTYKLKWPQSAHALYITINDTEDGRPFEVFINSKNMEHYAWTVALTRMISAVFRRGGEIEFVVEELKAVFDPRGGAWVEGKYIPSILAAIGGVIEKHMKEIGYMEHGEKIVETTEGVSCSACGAFAVVMIRGCATCQECGDSKCD